MMFRKETEFQETGIGEFPKEWEVKKLGDFLLFKNGKRPNIINEEGEIPVYGANGIMGYTNDYLVNYDTIIIIGRVGAAGKVHLARGKIWVSDNAIYAINRNKSKAYLNFIFYLLSYLNPGKFASKTTHPIITQKSLENLKVPLPPLEEQKRIAEILSTVDSGIETVDRAIAKLEGIKRILLNELLTGRIRVREENGKLTFYKETKFQGTEIGEIPKDWKIEMLGHLINYVKGKKPKKLYDQRINENNLPYLTAEYMRGLEAPKWCNPEEDPNIIKVNSDDVIMIWDGSYAGHVFTGFNGALASTMIKIVPKYNNLDKKFMYYYLTISFQRLRGTTIGTGVPHINKKIFEELYIPLPSSVKEQTAIAEILSTVDKAIELYRREKERFLRLRRGLMGVLLTGRVRVVSDVRDVGVVV